VKPVTVFTPKRAATAHPLGLAVAPDVRRHDGLVALVDQVADRLADQVIADRVALQPRVGEQAAPVFDVARRLQGLVHVEVIAPAGQFQAVIAHAPGERGKLGERQVGPLAGEKRDGTWHGRPPVCRGSLRSPPTCESRRSGRSR
jgi:hypothetical protein